MIQTFKTNPNGTCFIADMKIHAWYLSVSETATVLYYKENASTLYVVDSGHVRLCDSSSECYKTHQAKPLLPGESFTITI